MVDQIVLYYDEDETDIDLVVECYEILLDKMRNYKVQLLPVDIKIKNKKMQQE